MNDDTLENIKISSELPDFYDDLGHENEEKYQETDLKNCSECSEPFSNFSQLVEHFNGKHSTSSL